MTELPPELRAILQAAVHEMDRGDGEPQRTHLINILDWLRIAAYATGRPELGEVPYKLLEELNDIERDLLSPLFTPKRRKSGMRTWKVNLIALAVYVVDLAMSSERSGPDDERAAIGRVLPIVQRAVPEWTATTVANWRGDLQRRAGPRDLPKEVKDRYDTYHRHPPAVLGRDPEQRLALALVLLRSSIRQEARSQRSVPIRRK